MNRVESKFSSQFRHDILEWFNGKKKPVHIHLLVDAYRSQKKPYDAYVVSKKFLAIEFKVERGASVAYERVTQHQLFNLKVIQDIGNFGLIVLLLSRYKTVVCLTAYQWEEMFKFHHRIKIEDFLEYKEFIHLKRIKLSNRTSWELGYIYGLLRGLITLED